ncbi:hypothetical protein Sm713_22540 [Streptomyces sp. TS71-3]|nr:hypothetical protein Sm713_22540 [Streptomyces sp. TS71-3]
MSTAYPVSLTFPASPAFSVSFTCPALSTAPSSDMRVCTRPFVGCGGQAGPARGGRDVGCLGEKDRGGPRTPPVRRRAAPLAALQGTGARTAVHINARGICQPNGEKPLHQSARGRTKAFGAFPFTSALRVGAPAPCPGPHRAGTLPCACRPRPLVPAGAYPAGGAPATLSTNAEAHASPAHVTEVV